MAQQKFNNRFREALWEAYGKKCFHCTEELLLVDMQVDHLVPEHYHHGEPAVREAVFSEIGLPSDFDIQGHGNLVPSCKACNGQKSGSVLIGSAVAISLTRVQRTLRKLQASLNKKRGERELEDVLRAVVRSIEAGKFTAAEFREQLAKHAPEDSKLLLELKGWMPGTIHATGIKKLGFTFHAMRAMEARHVLPIDIADAVRDGIIAGTARVGRDDERYIIEGPDDLKVVFQMVGPVVVVLTAYRD